MTKCVSPRRRRFNPTYILPGWPVLCNLPLNQCSSPSILLKVNFDRNRLCNWNWNLGQHSRTVANSIWIFYGALWFIYTIDLSTILVTLPRDTRLRIQLWPKRAPAARQKDSHGNQLSHQQAIFPLLLRQIKIVVCQTRQHSISYRH